MYRNMVKNDRFFKKKSCSFILSTRKSIAGKFKIMYVHILNFPAPISTEFPCSKDKKSRNFKKISRRSLPYLYACPDNNKYNT